MDANYTTYQWISMAIPLFLISITLLYLESTIECTDGSYLPILWVMVVFLIMILGMVVYVFVAKDNAKEIYLGIAFCIVLVFVIYLPIHFFIVDGCEPLTKSFLYACIAALYFSLIAFFIELKVDDIKKKKKEESSDDFKKADDAVKDSAVEAADQKEPPA